MNIYIVTWEMRYDSNGISGCFSSREKAIEYIEALPGICLINPDAHPDNHYWESGYYNFTIDEFTVDIPQGHPL